MLRDGAWKLVVGYGDRTAPGGASRAGLYDREADPMEAGNLCELPRAHALQEALVDRLLDRLMETEDRGAPREAQW